jgi:hypothetical protein
MKKCITLITLVLLSCAGYTQERVNFIQGEIQKKDHAKIVCFVQHVVSYGDWVKYRLGSNAPIDSISISEIRLLKTQYSEFENVIYEGEERLMHKQVRGKFNLYVHTRMEKPKIDDSKPKKDTTYKEGEYTVTRKQLKGTFAYITTTLYLLHANDALIELTEENFRLTLNEKMANCPSIKKAIDDPSLQLFKVGKVIQQYNTCN